MRALCGRLRDSGCLERAAGGRGQAVGGAIPVGTRGCIVPRENADHAYHRGVRFSGVELQEVCAEVTQTEGKAADQACQEKRLDVLSQGARDHQKQRFNDAGSVDRPTEPGTERMVSIPPASRSKTNLQQAGQLDILASLEVGEAQASEEVSRLDQE
ncbi:hypothetical protein D3C78_1383400 [compost metagenome]